MKRFVGGGSVDIERRDIPSPLLLVGNPMALHNYSMAVHKLGYDIVSWFTLSKGPFFGVKNVFLFFVIDWLCVVGIS